MPILDESSFNVFTTYRSRAWNGTIGETEIKTAYGGFFDKTYSFEAAKGKQNLNIRFGTAKYEAEELKNTKFTSLWRTSLFASLDSEYQIWRSNRKKIDQNRKCMKMNENIRIIRMPNLPHTRKFSKENMFCSV